MKKIILSLIFLFVTINTSHSQWFTQFSVPQNITFNTIWFPHPSTGYASTNDKKIMISTNGGYNWTTQFTASENINICLKEALHMQFVIME